MTKHSRIWLNHQKLLSVLILSISLMSSLTNTTRTINHRSQSKDLFKSYRSFKTSNNSKIVAQLGSSVILPCSLDGSSSDTVTWIRKSDYKLLTVGRVTYSSDERFRVEHVRHRGIWNLQISSLLKKDEGVYECNLSTHPPMSLHMHLTVLEPIAEIRESPEIYISEGSVLKLECKIVNAIENPAYIFWYHNSKMINFSDDEDGLSVLTIPPQNITIRVEESHKHNGNPIDANKSIYRIVDDASLFDGSANSHSNSNDDTSKGIIVNAPRKSKIFTALSSSILIVNQVRLKDSGNYTCQPSNTRPTWIDVHVTRNSGNSKALRYFARNGFFHILNSASSSCISCDWKILLWLMIVNLWMMNVIVSS